MRSKQNTWIRSVAFALALLSVCMMFLLSNGIIYASAAEQSDGNLPLVRVEEKTVHRGQTFEIRIYLDQNPGLISLMLDLEYDKSAMELVGITRGDALSTHTFTTTNTDTDEGFLISPFRMLWDGRTQDSSTGVIAILTFESKVDAPIGDYPIIVNYDKQNTKVEYEKTCDVLIDNGLVTLIKGEYSVRYINYDGTLLYEKDYSENAVPSYGGPVPQRPTDERYSYEFKGWRGIVSDVPNVICYEAEYLMTPQIYQVFFYVDGEYFHAFECPYSEIVDLSNIPSKKNHVFSGWYMDEAMTEQVSTMYMPAHDIVLYGHMKFNIRENPIPEITLSVTETTTEYVYVAVDITRNPSLSGLVLTLDYDRSALAFEGFERGEAFGALQFDHTNTEQGYTADPFRFYWEHTVNTTDIGRLLVLKFKINHEVQGGVYGVTMTYEPTTDAVFIDDHGNLSYTMLNIVGAQIPLGEIYYWNEEIPDVGDIAVECPVGMPADTILKIDIVTSELNIPNEHIYEVVAPNMEIKAAYTIKLMRNNMEVEPDGFITVRIKLTDAQKMCSDLRIYHIDDNGTMTFYESEVQDGYIVFKTDHLSHWAIIGNMALIDGVNGSMPSNSHIIIIGFALLAIACMAFCLIMIAKKKDWSSAKYNKKGENNT